VFEWFQKNASCPFCRGKVKPQLGMKAIGVEDLVRNEDNQARIVIEGDNNN